MSSCSRALVLIFLWSTTFATEYFVALDGVDSNPGTASKPWRHVQHAVSILRPGDICTIRQGRYYETNITLENIQGNAQNPITFRALPNETVSFDGTAEIPAKNWQNHEGKIYVNKLDFDIWQLFVDSKMQTNARWPDAHFEDLSIFDYTRWGFSAHNSTYDVKSGKGVMNDNGTQNLAKSGLNATGAMALLNIGSWETYTGRVDYHSTGSNTFSYSVRARPKNVAFGPSNCRYYLEDKLEFLDSPTEWFYDVDTRELYLWTLKGDSPENHDVRGKVSTYAFEITGNSSYVTLSNLEFFATTIRAVGKVNGITLDSLNFTYPSYTRRMLQDDFLPEMTKLEIEGSFSRDAGNFTVFNCTWQYADGQTMSHRGVGSIFENNLWRYNDFSCVGDGMLFGSKGARDHFIRNTVHSNGPSEGFNPGSGDPSLGILGAAEIRLNEFYDQKHLQNDGSQVQVNVAAQNGTIIEYNWSHDTRKWGLRFDREMREGAPWGYNATVRYNVVWNTSGIMIKGDYHHVTSNLAFDNIFDDREPPETNKPDLLLLGYPGGGQKGENVHTVTENNILKMGACEAKNTPPSNCTHIPGIYKMNVIGPVRQRLRDPDNLDFRPLNESENAGPYGKESFGHGGVYWIPGRVQVGASRPVPPDGSVTSRCGGDLMWLGGYEAKEHDLYLGNDATAVESAGLTSALYRGKLDGPGNVFTVKESFKAGQVYYWRVDAVRGDGATVRGSVWMFRCRF